MAGDCAPALRHSTVLMWLQPTYKIGDPILHIELRRWADMVLVAPCSANTLSKIANGTCDNLAVRLILELYAGLFISQSDIVASGIGTNNSDVYLSCNEHADV